MEVWRRALAAPPNVTSLRVNGLRTDVNAARQKLADHLRRAALKRTDTAEAKLDDDDGEQSLLGPQVPEPTVHPVLRDVIILPCTVPNFAHACIDPGSCTR
jgi:hypothetical protein